jgi:large subunit ribosomal protein L19
MDSNIFKSIEKSQEKKRPDIKVGDTIKLHLKIKEGSKERVQQFRGVVISLQGKGVNRNVVVRKISYGIGVEKIVPLNSDLLLKVEIVKRGTVKKSKLFYLRKRVGRRALKVNNIKDVHMEDEKEEEVATDEVRE